MRLKPVNQQVVVIMGASSGIGRATALMFAQRGARVVVAARSAEALGSLVKEIQRKGGKATAITADVAVAEQVKHVADQAVAEYGRLDTWAHVAAVSVFAPFEQTRPDEFKRLLEVNLLGQIHGALAALPHLRREGGGALVHVSSVEAKIAFPFSSGYAASKHGVAGFLGALRLELLREGAPISVTTIMPTSIDTPLFRNALSRLGVEGRGPAPVYEPDTVARAIVYAAEHPVRDVAVGGGAVGLLMLERLSPRLVDQILLGQMGFEAQLTATPRSPDAPNNLFVSLGEDKVHGDLHAEASQRSPLTSLQTNVVARAVAQVSRFGFAVVGRAVNALYALRYGRALRRGQHEGGGLPAPVVTEARREAHVREEAEKSIKLARKQALKISR